MTDWYLNMNEGPIYMQIGQNVRALLARGDLQPGEKLPSARELAQRLGVNPNTVIHAYTHLETQGVIETKRGRGTFIREDAPVAMMRREMLQTAAKVYSTEIERLGVPRDEALTALEEVMDGNQPE